MPEERMLGSIHLGNTCFYATNSRVLRHEKKFLGERLDDASYPHISSTTLEHGPNEDILAAGTIVAIFGFGLAALGSIFSTFLLSSGVLFLVIGVLVILIAFLYKTSWWQIGVIGVSGDDRKRWRLRQVNREEAESFVRLIQDQIRPRIVVERERESSKESVIQRDIVKVRCQHCGGLNLETSQSCANCGAML